MLMMLAFVVDQSQQLCCALFRAVWAKLGSKRLVWERLRALFSDDLLESMREVLEALWYGFVQARPILMTDPAYILRIALICRVVNLAIPHRHRWGLPTSSPVLGLRRT